MSLSFPLLISAVPLWAVDMSAESNQQAPRPGRTGSSARGRVGTDQGRPLAVARHAGPAARRRALLVLRRRDQRATSRCTSSTRRFPPADVRDRPDGFRPGEEPDPDESRERMAAAEQRGRAARDVVPLRPEPGSEAARRVRERGRADDAEPRRRRADALPGYRDRIVHVQFTAPDEGGMNLTMPAPVIRP